MCISADLASFQATIEILTRAPHPRTGRTMHTLVYRNAPENLAAAGRGNAMLLHFPAAEPMDESNVIDTSAFPHCAEDIRAAVPSPRGEGRSMPEAGMSGEALVFEHGIYHVVLAQDAASIPSALDRVPGNKRPKANPTLFDWYGKKFPEYTLALCCFDNREAALADPLLWWYYPLLEDWLMLPAVDAHDGSPPDLDSLVDTDHFVGFGSCRPAPHLSEVRYTDPVPEKAKPYLPKYVIGEDYIHPAPNGDFIVPLAALEEWETDGYPTVQRGFLPL